MNWKFDALGQEFTKTSDFFKPESPTGAYDFNILKQRGERMSMINKAISRELKEEKVFSNVLLFDVAALAFLSSLPLLSITRRDEFLKKVTNIQRSLEPSLQLIKWGDIKAMVSLVERERERIEVERERNKMVYKELKAEIYKRYRGKYVVIARGGIQAVGTSLEDVRGAAMDANHRFVFRVEPRRKKRGILRWPMKKR